MILPDYLSQAAATPFAWGQFDCMLFLADWVREQHGVDPAAPWRGKYSTAREARRILGRHGGVAGIVRDAIGRSLITIELPRPGDIGVVLPAGKNVRMGAIKTGSGWAVLKRGGGIWVGPHRPVVMWSIG